MVENINIHNVLFIDIETVSSHQDYSQLPERLKPLWEVKGRAVLKKYGEQLTEEEMEASYNDRAGIYAEFGKIVCISVGIVVKNEEGNLSFRAKSFANEDERKLLIDFSEMLEKHYNNPNKYFFCGHNIKEFDVPFTCRRLAINGLPLPGILDITGKKPWETKHLLDTMELWKFGDYKSYTSLSLLTAIFDIPTPKDDIDGSQVGRVFWEEKDLERIAVYCEKDVLAVAQLLLKFQRKELIAEDQIKWSKG